MLEFSTTQTKRLAHLAALVAIEAPARISTWATDARIPWALINDIREALALAGFDWKLAALERKRIEDQRRAERRAAK